MHKYLKGDKERLELHNSLEMMHVVWEIANSRDTKFIKRKYQSYKQSCEDVVNTFEDEETNTSFNEKLVLEQRRMREEIVSPPEFCDINQEIAKLER